MIEQRLRTIPQALLDDVPGAIGELRLDMAALVARIDALEAEVRALRVAAAHRVDALEALAGAGPAGEAA